MKVFILFSVGVSSLMALAMARPSAHEGKRLLKISEQDPGQWVNEAEILLFKAKHGNFMDVTDSHGVNKFNQEFADFPTTIRHQSVVNSAISRINTARTQEFVTSFSSYYNRYYTTDNGENAATSIFTQVNEYVAFSGYEGEARAELFQHSWKQPSVIARIQGSDPTLKNEIVILGAHLDSVSFGSIGKAPGADDNASGSSVLLEAFKSLLDSKFLPKRTIEFQWYAAEEVGLRGSQAIAEAYAEKGVKVHSMMNLDVVGYNRGQTEIGVNTDYVNPSLTAFIKLAIEEYLDFTWVNRSCGYACSDHASFTEVGYRTACPAESILHPDMHTVRDTIDQVNFVQVKEFTKLALAYLIEISEPAA